MRKSRLFILALAFLLSLGGFVHAQGTNERIRNFVDEITINPDSTINVTEKIEYDFGGNERHGIYRDIPTTYTSKLGKASISLSDISVVDGNGKKYEFTTSGSGGNKRIKIGDPDVYVRGLKTYIISYKVAGALGYFENFDELYWNVTGDKWDVPIDRAEATLHLPAAIASSSLQASCYEGEYDSGAQCSSTITEGGAHFVSSRSFLASEGMTVALGFPKGIVAKPTSSETFLNFLKNNFIVFLPLIALIFLFRHWYKRGRDAAGRGTIVAEYESPDNLTPAEISGLLHQGMKSNDISAEIISLAVRGYLHIKKIEGKKLFFASSDYELSKMKPIDESLPEFDKKILNGLFSEKETVLMSEMAQKFYTNVSPIKKGVMSSLIAKGYYGVSPQKTMSKYFSAGILIIFASVFLFHEMPVWIFSGVVTGALFIIFGFIMPARTKAGAIAKERVLGLKQYISIAEKDRINFHNAPEKNPELFEKLLPFAMIFGLETAWAKQFESIYRTPPSWYSDSSGSMFNALVLSNNLKNFSTYSNANLTSSPRGSGSGGGGFSGGGGGGGGGGSW